jgi:hypothetical protein
MRENLGEVHSRKLCHVTTSTTQQIRKYLHVKCTLERSAKLIRTHKCHAKTMCCFLIPSIYPTKPCAQEKVHPRRMCQPLQQ